MSNIIELEKKVSSAIDSKDWRKVLDSVEFVKINFSNIPDLEILLSNILYHNPEYLLITDVDGSVFIDPIKEKELWCDIWYHTNVLIRSIQNHQSDANIPTNFITAPGGNPTSKLESSNFWLFKNFKLPENLTWMSLAFPIDQIESSGYKPIYFFFNDKDFENVKEACGHAFSPLEKGPIKEVLEILPDPHYLVFDNIRQLKDIGLRGYLWEAVAVSSKDIFYGEVCVVYQKSEKTKNQGDLDLFKRTPLQLEHVVSNILTKVAVIETGGSLEPCNVAFDDEDGSFLESLWSV